jgi:hypothetical protein
MASYEIQTEVVRRLRELFPGVSEFTELSISTPSTADLVSNAPAWFELPVGELVSRTSGIFVFAYEDGTIAWRHGSQGLVRHAVSGDHTGRIKQANERGLAIMRSGPAAAAFERIFLP